MTPPRGLSLGIDLGTTRVKAILMDADGATVALASSTHGLDRVADGIQADPLTWWNSTCAALAALALEHPLTHVAAVGLSGNMSALVLVDEQLCPVAPALLLADERGAAEIGALDAEVLERIVRTTGNRPSTVFTLSSLLWWSRNDGAVLARAAAALSAKDYLRARLTGRLATDLTDAFNSLVVGGQGWDHGLIAELGLPSELFPTILTSDAVAGQVSPSAAAETGLPAGTPVVTGSGDVAAALAGGGGLADDELAVSLGTSVTLMAPIPSGPGAPAPAGLTRHPASDGSWFLLGSLLTGGLALNWMRGLFGADAIAAASDIPDADDPILFLPYLAGTGSPDFVGGATGALQGIPPATQGRQIVAAALEAVAFDLALLIEQISASAGAKFATLTLSGGGTQVAAWPQIIADVVGMPASLLDQPEGSAAGAARYGWAALGVSIPRPPPAALVQPRKVFAADWRTRRDRFESARASHIATVTQPRPQ